MALGWSVVVRHPSATAFAAVKRANALSLAIGLVAALAAASVAWAFANRLSQPLRNIAIAARRIERGVPGASIPKERSTREVHALSESLDSMTQRLLDSKQELERRVLERTEALETANAELARLAHHDPLTGLLNRRAFAARFDLAQSQLRRNGGTLAVLLVDADHFKSVNDRFGHGIGDEVLQTIAATIRSRVRDTDAVARLGGEEFAVLLPETDSAGAMRVAETLVRIVGDTPMPGAGRVTVSIGAAVASWSEGMQSVLLERADAALYTSKRTGRNRATLHGERPQPALALVG